MANGVFNISKGEGNGLHDRVNDNNPGTAILRIILLQAVADTDVDLAKHDTLADVLAVVGNTEATFTNYGRKALDNTDLTAAVVDDGAATKSAPLSTQVWDNAGGAVNNTLVKFLTGYDGPGNNVNSEIQMITHQDLTKTTDGLPLQIIISTGYYYRAG